jgi:hypothetical protein
LALASDALTARAFCGILGSMRIHPARSAAVGLALLAATLVAGACSLTGPLDGYSGGAAPTTTSGPVQDAGTGEAAPVVCATGRADCDGRADNGCETSLLDDVANCGSCKTVCTAPSHSQTACKLGKCATTGCETGWGDCDSNSANGCEIDLKASVSHCGACGKVCSASNAASSCVAGACQISKCNAGFGDCDGNASNGCETPTTTVQDCGECRKACTAGSHATPACTNGTCGAQCQTGFGDCDAQAANGCEVDLTTDPKNCSACKKACGTANGTASCDKSACKIACNTGFANCNTSTDDGCEVDTRNDPVNCSQCGSKCPTPTNAQPTCTAGSCGFLCTSGFADCDGTAANGCEINLNTTQKNCGACGHDCLDTICTAGSCASTAIATKLMYPWGIALDASSIYWTDGSDDKVRKMAKSGGTATTLASIGAGQPIATDGTNVYWFALNRIASVPVGGGVLPSDVAANEKNVTAMAVDSKDVYWLRGGSGPTDGAVVRAPTGGGSVTVLTSGLRRPASLAIDNDAVFWVNQGDGGNGSIARMYKGSGGPTTLAQSLASPCALAIDATHLFWIDCQTGTVSKMTKGGSSVVALATAQKVSPALAVDDSGVYWAWPGDQPQQATGTIMRVPLAGGTPVTIAAQQNHPRRLALDAQRVFWVNSGTQTTPPPGDGEVRKVAK